MSEPRRLMKGGGSEFERLLLRSAQKDAPSADLRPKTLAALGLGAGIVGAGSTATAAAAAGKVAAKIGILKWIGFGVLSGVVVVAAAGIAPRLSAPPATPAPIVAAEAPVSPAPRQAANAPARAAEEAPAPPEAEPAPASPPPAADPASARKADAPRAHTSAEPERSALTEEIASLDVAREALASGNAARALQALDQHDRAFPHALLGPEATVLRIEALAQRGDRAGAARLGEAFLAAHPRSPAASRVRSLIGAPAPTP